MPPQTTRGGLLGRMGTTFKQAFEACRGDETEYNDFGDLPAGIVGGIAQLVRCGFDVVKEGKKDAGKVYFTAQGLVCTPKEFQGQIIAGLRTMVTEPMYPTPTRARKTVPEHVRWIANQLRLLGLETADMEADDVEAACAALEADGPCFKFRTYKMPKNTSGPYKDRDPMTRHDWGEWCEFTPDDVPPEGLQTQDEGEVGQEQQEQAAPPSSPAKANGISKPAARPAVRRLAAAKPTPPPPMPPAEEPTQLSDADLDGLAELADQGDADSAATLAEACLQAGMTEEDVAGFDGRWNEAIELLKTGEGEPAVEQEPEATPEPLPDPAKGDAVRYKPRLVDPKTRRQTISKKVSDCTVVLVDVAKRTVALKDLSDGKTLYKGVSWDDLEPDA